MTPKIVDESLGNKLWKEGSNMKDDLKYSLIWASVANYDTSEPWNVGTPKIIIGYQNFWNIETKCTEDLLSILSFWTLTPNFDILLHH